MNMTASRDRLSRRTGALAITPFARRFFVALEWFAMTILFVIALATFTILMTI